MCDFCGPYKFSLSLELEKTNFSLLFLSVCLVILSP